MNKRTMGLIALLLGLVLVFLGLAADHIGLGEGTRLGWKQITALTVGVLSAGWGAIATRSQR